MSGEISDAVIPSGDVPLQPGSVGDADLPAEAAAAVERLRALQALTAGLAEALTAEDVVRTVLSNLDLLGASAGGLWTVGDDAVTLVAAVGYTDLDPSAYRGVPLSADLPVVDCVRSARPVYFDAAERDRRYPGLRGTLAGSRAFAALPLVAHGRVFGALTVSFPTTAVLDDGGAREFLQAVAAQGAVAMHRVAVLEGERRALHREEEAVRRLGRLQELTARMADLATTESIVDIVVSEIAAELGATRAFLALVDESQQSMRLASGFGMEPEVLARWESFPLTDAVPAGDAAVSRRPVVLTSLEERDARYPVLVGTPPHDPHTLVALPLLSGERVLGSLSMTFGPRSFEDDDLTFLMAAVGQCAQAIERARLRDGQLRRRQQLALLAETGRMFATSLDLDSTLDQVCRLVVPTIADGALVRVIEDGDQLRPAAIVHVDPQHQQTMAAWAAALPAELTDTLLRMIEQGEPQFADGAQLAQVARTSAPELADRVAAMDVGTVVTLPLKARGRSVGVFTLAVRRDEAPVTADDVPFLIELASRVALAMDNLRLFRQQAEIAHTLQRSLLPAELPDVEHADVAVAYLPGMEGTYVGGDFYDVIPLPTGRVGLVIGDVMGRGVRAAAAMGQLRAAVRSYALEGHRPSALLARLDRLVTALEEGLLVTCVYGEWDPRHHLVTLASAGHLPPLLRRPGEAPSFVDVDPGVPLGVGRSGSVDVDVDLPPGSLLIAYTDGLVEGPEFPLDEGMRRLAEVVGDRPLAAVDACRAALVQLRPARRATRPDGGNRHEDDIAMLALVTQRPPSPVVDRTDGAVTVDLPADSSSPGHARTAVRSALREWELEALTDTATLLVSELVTNAVRHAGTALRMELARSAPSRLRVEVVDYAPNPGLVSRRAPLSAEGGRGLFLVESLASAWGSDALSSGKRVWFELDAADA